MFTARWQHKSAGSTASIAFIRNDKIYTGHVGDSRIILGFQMDGCGDWRAQALTTDHKPELPAEHSRIIKCGGQVVKSKGVVRVTRIKTTTGDLIIS